MSTPAVPSEAARERRHDVVDAVAAFVLVAVALSGFRAAFDGFEIAVVGAAASLIGAATGYLLVSRKVSATVGALLAVVVFFALGGVVAVRNGGLLGSLPTPTVLGDLVDGTVHGWSRLLTTLPPATRDDNVLAVPFLCGYAGALAAVVLALTARRWPWCALPPVAVLALSVLLGTDEPAALVLQGAVFGTVLVGWLALREDRTRPTVSSTRSLRRPAGALTVLGLAAAGAVIVGPALPMAEAEERYVLRDQVQPPFDPRQYPSPLGALRHYLSDAQEEQVFLVADGLPADVPVRLAVMDEYDGVVWTVGDGSGSAGGGFVRAGGRIPDAPDGRRVDVGLEVRELRGVWLPTPGRLAAASFRGGRARLLSASLRYERQLDMAAVPVGLRDGDRLQLTGVVPDAPDEAELAALAVDPRFAAAEVDDVPAVLKEAAADAVADAASPYAQAAALATWLSENGAYSDGGEGSVPVPPGHSLFHLADFLDVPQMVGNAEQYAATMAVMARSIGLPARVVVGFRPTGEGRVEITGDAIDAWVEVPFAGAGWVPFSPTPDRSHTVDKKEDTAPQRNEVDPELPPPPAAAPPDVPQDELEQAVSGQENRQRPDKPTPPAARPVAPVAGAAAAAALLALAPFASVVTVKRRRRARRRQRGPAEQRIAAGWQELLDRARDAGLAVPPRTTRREAARLLPVPGAAELAAAADAATFAPERPDATAATEFWCHVDTARRALVAPLPRHRRLRAAVSLASLRTST